MVAMRDQFEIALVWELFCAAATIPRCKALCAYQPLLPNCLCHLSCFCFAAICFLEHLAPLWRSCMLKGDSCGKPGNIQEVYFRETVSGGFYMVGMCEKHQCRLKKTPDHNEGCHNSIQNSHTVAHVERVSRHSLKSFRR